MSEYDNNNVFARILNNELPCKRVYEDEHILAIEDISPAAPVHVLILPKSKHISFDDFVTECSPEEVKRFFGTIPKIAKELGIQESGYRLIMNHGENASQTVPHFHVHLVGGAFLGGVLHRTTDKT